MNKREIEATVRNLPYWLPCPIMLTCSQAYQLVLWAGGWFGCPANTITIIGKVYMEPPGEPWGEFYYQKVLHAIRTE